jgi:hypothetical protein
VTETVNVVIATYRRPDQLRAAVTSLAESASRLPQGWAAGVTLVDHQLRSLFDARLSERSQKAVGPELTSPSWNHVAGTWTPEFVAH